VKNKKVLMLALMCVAMVSVVGIAAFYTAAETITEEPAAEAEPTSGPAIKLQIGNPTMTVNGQDRMIDEDGTVPVIQNGRTLLPVRAVVEAMGGAAEWDGTTQTATLSYGGNVIRLIIGSETAYLNDTPQSLDVTPVIIGGRTMLPIRFIAESFGFDVAWDGVNREVTLTVSARGNSSNGSNILVVYFSQPETGDPNDMTQEEANSTVVINGEVLGNTQYVAYVIQENTDADIFRIEPETPYPLDHGTLLAQAREEQNRDSRPAIHSRVDNIGEYDTVFLGHPTWWADMPMILYSFLEEYDLSGKTIIPFNTHGGSGFSNTINAIIELQPNAMVSKDGFTVSRNNVQDAKSDIIAWLNGLGYSKTNDYPHLTLNSPIIPDVIDHPAFRGFGGRMLPRDDSAGDFNNRLSNPIALNALNHLIDEVNVGKTVFYDIYTPQQKQQNRTKENTGLFFFRGEPGAPFAVVCPGGAWAMVNSLNGGFPIAMEINKHGYNVFVIRYRIGGEQIACEDLAAALAFIFANARTLEVGTQNYSLWGESAGARMAARLSSYGTAYYGAASCPKPVTAVIAYTAHSDFTAGDPATFTVAGGRDGIAPPRTMERRVNAMRAAGVPVEFHVFPDAPHGFALGIGTSAEGWIDHAVRFWENHMANDLSRSD
jgi:flavodoxin/acetyl esterase/lipase